VKPLELVQQVYVSHASRDTPMLLELLADDVEWFEAEGHPYAGTGPWRGHEEVVRNVVDPINTDWIDYRTEVTDMLDAGETVVVLGRYLGRYKATGAQLDAKMCTVYTVRQDRIVKWRQYTDTYQFRSVMGLLSDVAPPPR
jgi:ketosteroid isomerase-like protein